MLSVLINHYKSPVALKLCLKSAQESLAHIDHEIIVSDSAAEKNTQAMLRYDFPDFRYLPFEKNVGFAKLVNAGMREAKGEYFFILNADNIIVPGTLEALLTYLQQHEDVGMVGPKLEYQNGKHQPSAFRFQTPLIIAARRTLLAKTSWGKHALEQFTLRDVLQGSLENMNALPVDWLMGSAMLVRKTAAKDVGPFDERFFLYFEDTDWCRRFWEKKWKVMWFPKARIVHVHGQASKMRNPLFDLILNPYTRIHLRSAYLYFRKYGLKTPRYGV